MRAPYVCLAALFVITLAGVMTAENPFSFKDTPGKLPKEVVPTDYSIRIVPNIEKLTFSGTETVRLSVRKPVRQLVLNALELEISEASLDGKPLSKSAINIDKERELLIFALPSESATGRIRRGELAAGDHTLALSFSGKINQQGQGLFYMQYQEQASGKKKIMLGTQFEATDARRFFRCWDEPAFRARFQLTTVVLENWLAVSNMPVESEKKVDGGKEVRFAATPSMSSYLNVFVAGELDSIESRVGSTQIRVITTKGKAELGRYALEATAHFNPQWEVWLRRESPRDPTRRVGIAKEAAMEGDARSTTHPIQQFIATEAEANSAFDDITYKKGQSFLRMLESFLGEDVFRDGIRRYIAAHKYSNTTTADLWNALSDASNKSVGEIAAGWTEQAGFPVVNVKLEADGKVRQERFTVNFENAPPLLWQIPLTYSVVGGTPATLLMTDKTATLKNIPADRALKLNVNGAGNYRVEYDEPSWELLLKALPKLGVEDRVNLMSDAWALVQAARAPASLYFGLVEKLPDSTDLAEREQIINVLGFVNGLLVGSSERERFQRYARSLLRPTFATLGWEPKPNEPSNAGRLRASLISALGHLNDSEVLAGCRERFQKYLAHPASLPPDFRAPVLAVVGGYADEKTWNKLHELGLKTTSIEDQQNYYNALAGASDPKLVKKTLAIALTDELPTSRAIFLVSRVARDSDRPDIAWEFAKANMKALLAKVDAAGANRYAPSLFTFFSNGSRADEIKKYAEKTLAPASAPEVAKAVDENQFRAVFRELLVAQLLP